VPRTSFVRLQRALQFLAYSLVPEKCEVSAIPFCNQTGAANGEFVELFSNDLEICAHQGFVEPDQHGVLLNMIAVFHADFTDGASSGVLNLFHTIINDHRSLGQNCSGDLCCGRPSAEPAN
jgi:hypothetical protein